MILPFFWLFSASLMSPQELMPDVPKWLAEKPRTKPAPLYNQCRV
jgi:multiple sugar transport system permease protein